MGSVQSDFDCCITAAVDADCTAITKTISAVANTMVTGRVAILGTASAGSTNGFNTITFRNEFLLASMYQDSYSGSGTRGTAPANYCDK